MHADVSERECSFGSLFLHWDCGRFLACCGLLGQLASAHGRQSPAFLWELFLQAGDAAMQSEMELKIAWLKSSFPTELTIFFGGCTEDIPTEHFCTDSYIALLHN